MRDGTARLPRRAARRCTGLPAERVAHAIASAQRLANNRAGAGIHNRVNQIAASWATLAASTAPALLLVTWSTRMQNGDRIAFYLIADEMAHIAERSADELERLIADLPTVLTAAQPDEAARLVNAARLAVSSLRNLITAF